MTWRIFTRGGPYPVFIGNLRAVAREVKHERVTRPRIMQQPLYAGAHLLLRGGLHRVPREGRRHRFAAVGTRASAAPSASFTRRRTRPGLPAGGSRQSIWLRVWGLGFRVQVWGFWFRVWGLGFGVWGLGFRV